MAATNAQNVANWRARMSAEGHRTFRVQLPASLTVEIKTQQRACKLPSLTKYLEHLISTAIDTINIAELTMPPVTPKSETLKDITIMLPIANVAFITAIKDQIGLPRAKAIHALMLTVPDALERAAANRQQPAFNFNQEVMVKTK